MYAEVTLWATACRPIIQGQGKIHPGQAPFRIILRFQRSSAATWKRESAPGSHGSPLVGTFLNKPSFVFLTLLVFGDSSKYQLAAWAGRRWHACLAVHDAVADLFEPIAWHWWIHASTIICLFGECRSIVVQFQSTALEACLDHFLFPHPASTLHLLYLSQVHLCAWSLCGLFCLNPGHEHLDVSIAERSRCPSTRALGTK